MGSANCTWAPLTENAANLLELSGTLEGLVGLESRRLVEVNPVVTGRQTGEPAPAVRVAGLASPTRQPESDDGGAQQPEGERLADRQ